MFKPQAVIFLKNVLGDEGFEDLQKAEIYKLNTNTVVDPEEMKIGLQIVPRTILSLLQRELSGMGNKEGKKIKIPVQPEAFLEITKFANDVYSGEVIQNGKVLDQFRNRSLPGVGLVLLSSLSLYEVSDLDHMGSQSLPSVTAQQVQSMIEERLRVNDLVSRMVDQKISERNAIDEIVKMKLTQMLNEHKESKADSLEEIKNRKELPIKKFLDKTKKKNKSYEIKIEKNESVKCPDCGNKIFDQSGFSGCVCFGLDRNKKIHLSKSENSVKLSFSNQWDAENIEMLLEILRQKNRGQHE